MTAISSLNAFLYLCGKLSIAFIVNYCAKGETFILQTTQFKFICNSKMQSKVYKWFIITWTRDARLFNCSIKHNFFHAFLKGNKHRFCWWLCCEQNVRKKHNCSTFFQISKIAINRSWLKLRRPNRIKISGIANVIIMFLFQFLKIFLQLLSPLLSLSKISLPSSSFRQPTTWLNFAHRFLYFCA